MLEKEFQYYLANQSELAQKYNGKFVVIKGESVIGAYNSEADAYFITLKTEPIGTFLIQFCSSSTESHSQTFHSRVSFV